MTLRPLGDRVWIRPEKPAEETASGLVLVEHRKPEQVGTVVAVGTCEHPRKAEVEGVIASLNDVGPTLVGIHNVEGTAAVATAMIALRELVSREPSVRVGDTVIFPWTAGYDLNIDWPDGTSERVFVMKESDILAVLETA